MKKYLLAGLLSILPVFTSLPQSSVSQVIQQSSYEEVTKNAKPQERARFEAKLKTVPEGKQQELLIALKQGRWDSRIFQDPDYFYYALSALKQGQLSQDEFATVTIFWEVRQLHDSFETIPLFQSDGSVNPKAKELIWETLQIPPSSNFMHQLGGKQEIYILSDAQFNRFFDEVKRLPKAQQVIWKVPDLLISSKAINRALYFQGYNVFSRGHDFRLVPTLGLMQTFLNSRYGDNAVKINPVLGLSSVDAIRQNGLENSREMGFHSPAVFLKDQADGKEAQGYDFLYHDFSHAIEASAVPKKFRHIMVKLSDTVQNITVSNQFPEEKSDLQMLSGVLRNTGGLVFQPELRKAPVDVIFEKQINRFLDSYCKESKETIAAQFKTQLESLG